MFRKKHFTSLCLKATGILLAVSIWNAQAVTPTSVVLSGSTHPVSSASTTGVTAGRKPYISRSTLTSAETSAPMMFEVALKMRSFPELQARISGGERISQQEMATKYEPSAADYQAVLDWLKGEGFTIVRTDSHHLAVFARGPISQVASSLKLTFARVTADGKEYTSAVTAPSVPADISPLLVGINGLQPHLRAHKHLIKQAAHPDATTGSASYLPSQIAQAYGATGLYNSKITGAGQTIAIVIDDFPSTADLLSFWKNCNINQSISNIQFVQAVPGVLPAASSGEGEETLDVEWSSAMAPGAHIRVYATKDLELSDIDMGYLQVLDDITNHPGLGIHEMSMSFGEGETYLEATGGGPDSATETADQDFLELANAGVTIFASSGDSGSTPGPDGTGDESGPVQVDFPASDPNVVGVGGTTLELDSNNNVTLEKAWNNSIGASGGGASRFFSQPAWQTGLGVPGAVAPEATPMRDVPDVAAASDPNYGAIIYFTGSQTVVGGTSWACPTWAGICALINQSRTDAGLAPLGTGGNSGTTETLLTDIYPILNSANYSTNFHDITTGTNITSVSGSDYSTTQGFDMVTGIGSPHAQALAQTLIGSSTLVGLQMPPASQLILPGENTTFATAVGGGSATYQWQRMPIGSTTWSNLSDNGTYSGSATATLTVNQTTTAMSGDQFQCVVTLSGGAVVTTTSSALIVDTPLVISTLAGNAGTGALLNGTGAAAEFNIPSGIALDSSGNLYIADYNNNVIREVTPAGVVTTPYGSTSGTAGYSNGSGNSALFNGPNGIVADASNNLYVADTGNGLIRKIAGGSVSVLGSGGQFNGPEGVAVDSAGNVYVADTGNDTIRKITSFGVVSTFAGKKGDAGYRNGAATQALFDAPCAVAVDGAGNVYVADFGNYVVRKISGGQVTTLAGQPAISGYLDGPAGSALFNTPSGVAVDGAGNVYVADCLVPPLQTNATGNDLVRKISTNGVVSTLAGQPGNEGTVNGIGSAAEFYSVQAVALNNTTGAVYLADAYNQTIRMGVPEAQPSISVAATVPTAVAFGSTPGQVTVTRAGDTTGGLTVGYSLSGTAVVNTDYTPLSGTVTIPAGMTSAVVSVIPIADNQVTNPTVLLSVASSSAYTFGNPDTATLTIQEMNPYQLWSTNEFGANATVASIGGESADPNNNGVPNLLEYAFNSNPLQTGTTPLPTPSLVQIGDEEYLALTYTMLNNATDISYTVQVTSDLTGQTDQWHSGSTYTTVVSQTVNGNVTQVQVRDNTPASSTTHRFIRVQVGEN